MFKPGQKVVCIKGRRTNGLTFNSIYEVIAMSGEDRVIVVNDSKLGVPYAANRFKSLEEQYGLDP